MIIWLVWFTAVAWTTSRCEPPVNSYLPPGNGFGNGNRPSQQYGQPGASNQPRGPGLGGSGARNQPQDSYSPIGQQPPAPPNSLYGPPGDAGGAGPQRGFGSPSQKPNQSFGRSNSPNQLSPNQENNQGFGVQDSLSSSYGSPNNQGRPGPSGGNRNNFGRDSFGTKQRPDSSYGPPRNENRAPNEKSGGFGNNQRPENSYSPSQRNQQSGNREASIQPQSSYGPPPAGNPRDNTFSGQAQGQRSNDEQTPSTSYSSPDQDKRYNNQQPSTSYGTPEFGGSRGTFGGNADGESNEPAKYEFSYDVDDSQTGTIFGHSEQRDGDTAMGMYNVVLPDGRKQVVEYEAGRQGYKPQIRYEGDNNGGQGSTFGSGAGQGGSQGYPRGGPDDNQRSNNVGDYQTQQNSLSQYQQQQPSLGTEPGYPRGGPGNFGDNKQNQQVGGYPRQQGQSNGPGNNRGSNAGLDTGYPSNEPQEGRTFNGEDSPNVASGYSQNSPTGQRSGNLGEYPSNGSEKDSFVGRGSQRGKDFSSSDNEGYPRGGPGSQGGRNPPGRGRQSDRDIGSGGETGYPPRGGPAGPRGSGY